MIRRAKDFYSHLFQEEDDVTTVYFSTISGSEYRVYFYPVSEYYEGFPEDSILFNCGYFFGFTKMAPNEEKAEPIDFKVRNTILRTIEEFFEQKGNEKVLIFYCDDYDGKNFKRASAFHYWYSLSDIKSRFTKLDEEILVINENGKKLSVDFLSIIFPCDNREINSILFEFQALKERLIANK